MLAAENPLHLDFNDAFEVARDIINAK
jgi:hypothetical protein